MLIRVLFTPGAVTKYLDERQLLEMPEARKDRATMWREYLVVWKVSCIELYEPYVRNLSTYFIPAEIQIHVLLKDLTW
jgi:hypothetical protein